jgi:hypothetical protein
MRQWAGRQADTLRLQGPFAPTPLTFSCFLEARHPKIIDSVYDR